MAMKPGLTLRQSQSLKMTQQMRQAIELLQLSSLDLQAAVDSALETNPLLERASEQTTETERSDDAPTPTAQDIADILENALPGGTTETSLDGDDAVLADNMREGALPASAPSMIGQADGGRSQEEWQTETPTLRAHLEPQIEALGLTPINHAIAFELLGALNSAGYITEMPDEMAQRLDVPEADIENVLTQLQDLDPTGVFARGLADCLALQLKERDRLDPAMAALLEHLDLAANRDMAGLTKVTGQAEEDVMDMIKDLRSLDPKPGLAFEETTADAVIPDATLTRQPDGTLRVELTPEALPKLIVNETYLADVRQGPGLDGEDRAWLSKARADASFLVKSLDQRARSVLAVATIIAEKQTAYFEEGVKALKPMTLADVASEADLHESTVSRVVANKFLSSPQGTQPFKLFFSSRLASSADEDGASGEAVRATIKEMIAAEEPLKPLSDDKLANALKAQGITVARRTVAKYRESLNIPSSSERRKRAKAAF